MTIDTLRADHLGCYGYAKIKTPNLDKLAEKGTLFENAVCQVPITPPSHASIFTGTYPVVHQVRNVAGFNLDPSHRTLAEMLQERGWQTAAFVGAAVLAKTTGLNQGFQTYDDTMNDPELGVASPRVQLKLTGRIRLLFGFDFANSAPNPGWRARLAERASFRHCLLSTKRQQSSTALGSHNDDRFQSPRIRWASLPPAPPGSQTGRVD